MSDILISMLTTIFGSGFTDGAAGLKDPISKYNTAAYDFANLVNSTAVKPIAATIVAIVLVLEFARISSRYEGDQKTGTQQVALAVMKSAMVVLAIQNIDMLIAAINEVGDKVIAATADVTPTAQTAGLSDTVKDAVNDADVTDQVALLAILFIPWLLALVASIALKLVVFIRFAEVYILSAAATLPVAFMAHPETKTIAIGYLRKYGAVVLQGVMILVVIGIYNTFQIDAFDLSTLTADNLLSQIASNIGAILLGPLLFLFLIFASSRLAKALVGE